MVLSQEFEVLAILKVGGRKMFPPFKREPHNLLPCLEGAGGGGEI